MEAELPQLAVVDLHALSTLPRIQRSCSKVLIKRDCVHSDSHDRDDFWLPARLCLAPEGIAPSWHVP